MNLYTAFHTGTIQISLREGSLPPPPIPPIPPREVSRQDKTRQDKALFGVLYSPMYIDFLSKVCVCVSVGDGGAHSVLGLGQI